jgi:8-oxo-dGTP diphosphatase
MGYVFASAIDINGHAACPGLQGTAVGPKNRIMNQKVRVGLSVFVRGQDGTLLFGRRKNSHGDGSWANPGGHLEFGESFDDCAKREVFEECGLEIGPIQMLDVTNDLFQDEGKHYVTLHVVADVVGGELSVKEPEKIAEWRWIQPPHWPEPLFLTIRNLLGKHERERSSSSFCSHVLQLSGC